MGRCQLKKMIFTAADSDTSTQHWTRISTFTNLFFGKPINKNKTKTLFNLVSVVTPTFSHITIFYQSFFSASSPVHLHIFGCNLVGGIKIGANKRKGKEKVSSEDGEGEGSGGVVLCCVLLLLHTIWSNFWFRFDLGRHEGNVCACVCVRARA